MTLRKWVLKIHLYGGLLCFWYLIIFAVSSLQFQHHFDFMNPGNTAEIKKEKVVQIPESIDNSVLAGNLQNSIGMAGWYLPWETSRDSTGIFKTTIQNPKARYRLIFEPATSTVKIQISGNGFWRVFNSLHGYSGNMPNAPLMVFWKIFTYICLMVVTFSIFSGIWLWAAKSGDKSAGLLTASGIIVLSLILMIAVYING